MIAEGLGGGGEGAVVLLVLFCVLDPLNELEGDLEGEGDGGNLRTPNKRKQGRSSIEYG